MVGPSVKPTTTTTVKFLCSYGGKILPRYPDGKLRYLGGETRVLAVDRSISFAELLLKLAELCGASVSLRCQLPTEDLDALVSITCDEDLANLIEEYDRGGASSQPSNLKIRAFLSPPKSIKKVSPPPSSPSASSSCSSYGTAPVSTPRSPMPAVVADGRCLRQIAPQMAFHKSSSAANKVPYYAYHAHGNPGHIYLIHNGNHWQ
ncbi:PB1 domain containing protein [Trema orientale]|uniref:PB1 domain containing protein n=1 Tax=Trema orientale TaxID=63057 RepID=A0A2P5FMP2_TREOI|nr:PB1 domain containing protein [Trema orientale]